MYSDLWWTILRPDFESKACSSKVGYIEKSRLSRISRFSISKFCALKRTGRLSWIFVSHFFSHGNGSGMHPPIQHTALDRATVPAIQHTALDRAGRPDSCHQCGAGTYGILTNAIASAPRKQPGPQRNTIFFNKKPYLNWTFIIVLRWAPFLWPSAIGI